MESIKSGEAGVRLHENSALEAWMKPEIVSFEPIKVTEFNGGKPGDGNSNVS